MVCHENKTLGSGHGGMKANWIRTGLAMALCLGVLRVWPQQTNAAEAEFQDNPAAHKLYREMIQAMRKATTLSWTGKNRWNFEGRFVATDTYRIWLKKPNYARVEMTRTGGKESGGILAGRQAPLPVGAEWQICGGIRKVSEEVLHEDTDARWAALNWA